MTYLSMIKALYPDGIYRKPVTPTPPTVVENPLFARIRLADKIRWKDGVKIVSEQWSGQLYKVAGTQGNFTLLEYGGGVIGRLSQNIKVA